jgi:sugar/nucleoside kinase (ribokinase family)
MDVISFGSVFLELVFGHIRRLPAPGQEIFTDEFAISCGGAVSCATAARRAGATAGLCTLLGHDLGSQVVVEHCEREDIDLSPTAWVHRRVTGITTVFNFEGDRSFVTHVPRHPAGEPAEAARWLDVLRRYRPAWCYLHAGPGIQDFLREASELGSRTLLDISLGTAELSGRDVIECVRLADVFVPNQAELAVLTGTDQLESAVATAAQWGTSVVVKRGADGAMIVGPDGILLVTDGIGAVKVADRTGAGDAFAGAMLAALAHGAPLPDAVIAGNAAGSEAVARLGAVGPVEVEGLSTSLAQCPTPHEKEAHQ